MKSNIFFIALFLILGLSNCTKTDPGDITENSDHCQVAGTWKAISVIEAGEEALGGDVESFTMEYKSNNTFTWKIFLSDGGQTTLMGNFTESECTELKLNFDANDDDVGTINFDLNINGSVITLRGWIDGDRFEIEASRIN